LNEREQIKERQTNEAPSKSARQGTRARKEFGHENLRDHRGEFQPARFAGGD